VIRTFLGHDDDFSVENGATTTILGPDVMRSREWAGRIAFGEDVAARPTGDLPTHGSAGSPEGGPAKLTAPLGTRI
jgi:hypothetical protein